MDSSRGHAAVSAVVARPGASQPASVQPDFAEQVIDSERRFLGYFPPTLADIEPMATRYRRYLKTLPDDILRSVCRRAIASVPLFRPITKNVDALLPHLKQFAFSSAGDDWLPIPRGLWLSRIEEISLEISRLRKVRKDQTGPPAGVRQPVPD